MTKNSAFKILLMNLLNCQSSFCVTLEVSRGQYLHPIFEARGRCLPWVRFKVVRNSSDGAIEHRFQNQHRVEPPCRCFSYNSPLSFLFSGKLSKESQFSFGNLFFSLSFFLLDPILWKQLRNPCCVGKGKGAPRHHFRAI